MKILVNTLTLITLLGLFALPAWASEITTKGSGSVGRLILIPVLPGQPLSTEVVTRFRYSDASGDGRRNQLTDGSTLQSRALISLDIDVIHAGYLYIYHTDCRSQNELLAMSSVSNRVRRGQQIRLPRQADVLALNDKVGTEYFFTIVAAQPLSQLMSTARYKDVCGRLESIPKGLIQSPKKQVNGQQQRIIHCPLSEQYCSDRFLIHHI
jgi:hypothetical protein